MLFSKTASEIKRGLWAMDPLTAFHNIKLAQDIVQGNIKEEAPKIEASVYEVLNEDGIAINSQGGPSEIPTGSIGVISIHGNMIKYGNRYCWGSDELVAFAKAFDTHPNIIGQIWKFDTGGGSVGAVHPYRHFLKHKSKPVVSLCELCASAGIWASSPTDYQMAENDISSAFGSIGVMASFMSYIKYYQDLGIEEHTIYSSLSGDKNKDYQEAIKGNYKLLQQLTLDPLAEKFQQHIKEDLQGRLRTDIDGILTGRMFYAEEAVEYGLINSIGSMELAIEKVKELHALQSFMSN